MTLLKTKWQYIIQPIPDTFSWELFCQKFIKDGIDNLEMIEEIHIQGTFTQMLAKLAFYAEKQGGTII